MFGGKFPANEDYAKDLTALAKKIGQDLLSKKNKTEAEDSRVWRFKI